MVIPPPYAANITASSNYEHHCRRRDVETDDVDGCGDLNHEIARCDLGQGHSSQRSVEDQRNHRFIGPQQCRRTAWQLNMSRNTFYTTYMVVPWAGFLEPSRKSLRPLLMWRQRSGSLSPSSTNTPIEWWVAPLPIQRSSCFKSSTSQLS